MSKIELQLPALEHKLAAEKFKNEFLANQESMIPGSALLDQMDYERWLIHTANNRDKNTVSSDWVVTTTFFAIRKRDQKIIGMIDVRHNLENEFLAQFGGHIGFSVCPSERKKGYATEILKMGLMFAKSLDIEKVMVSCFSDNIPSIRTIEKCDGKLSETKHFKSDESIVLPDSDGKSVLLFWITL
jgi:predicted acetyltransferase